MITLREVRDEDLPSFFEHQRDPEATRLAAFTPRDWPAFNEHWRTRVLGTPGGMARTILLDGACAGNVVSWAAGAERMVGYWIARELWGRGIASAALAEFLRAHDLSRPLRAYVAAHNLGSIRVLEKCGFVRHGEAIAGHDGVVEWRYELP